MKLINIDGFVISKGNPNFLHYGYLYEKDINIFCANMNYQKRKLRIWVPGDFDLSKKYGVIYMVDGQNAVDESLTMYGEWNLEDHLKTLEETTNKRFIIVGIDCPSNGIERGREYIPFNISTSKYKNYINNYGDKFISYLVNNLVPLINKTFNVDYNYVGFLGSSFGGTICFYACYTYPNIFRFCLAFSPCFEMIKREELKKYLLDNYKEDLKRNKWYFYCGKTGALEVSLERGTNFTYKFLKELGINIYYHLDKTYTHNEKAWSDHFLEAIKYIL